MNIFRWLIIFAAALMMVSCAAVPSAKNGAEFNAGRLMAWEYAKQDALAHPCFLYPLHIYPQQEARKYRPLLESQGRSERFIAGFEWGYYRDYLDFADLYCGR